MSAKRTDRDSGIDALRGLAIAAMVASHLAREVLVEPHPLALRIYGSTAAPLFIALAGLLVAQTSAGKQYPLSYYAHRGGAILLLAALVDVGLWGLYPFVGWDVLYLIGLALPLTALYCRLPFAAQAVAMALVLFVPVWLRSAWGYPERVFAMLLGESPSELLANGPRILQQWLWTGWFPLLPWLGFSLFGVWMFRWRHASSDRANGAMRWTAAMLMLFGLAWGWLAPTPLLERSGYTELFYPPTTAFMLVAAGMVLALFTCTDYEFLKNSPALARLGRCSLLIYIAHLAILHWLVMPLVGEVDLGAYLILYSAICLMLLGLAGAVEMGKQRSARRLPFMLRLLLGS